MPFGSKKGKTAASNNKQLCLGLPDIHIAAVARLFGLQERVPAAGIDDDGGAAGEPARVNQHDAQATAARDAALLEATEECIAYLGANPSFVDRVTNRLRLNATLSDKIIALRARNQPTTSGIRCGQCIAGSSSRTSVRATSCARSASASTRGVSAAAFAQSPRRSSRKHRRPLLGRRSPTLARHHELARVF